MPDHIQKPPYVGSSILPEISSEYQMHDSEGVAQMRAACQLAARVLDYAGTLVRVSFWLLPSILVALSSSTLVLEPCL